MSETAISEAGRDERGDPALPASGPAAPEPLWTGLALVAPLGARLMGGTPRRGAGGVSIDTRTLKPDDLFFAIKGANSDGHDHVRAAFAAGALAAVVDEAHADMLAGAGPLYVVADVLASLESLGAAARARTQARIAAVTGSVGKTSTKEMLRVALGGAGQTHASVASYNNHWGVPLTLARMPRASRFGVFEIGMNHAGEIAPLARLTRPHLAVVTAVEPVHIENFSGLEAIADAKAEIFDGFEPGAVAVLPRDAPHFERLAARARQSAAGAIASFGESPLSDARLVSAELAADHSRVEADVCGRRLSYRLGAAGRHQAKNSLAALLAAFALGADLKEAAAAFETFAPQPGRGERLILDGPNGRFTLIDESYNANPASMRAAFALAGALPPPRPGRRIAALGDMLELGAGAPQMHADLAADIAAQGFDLVFAAGPLSRRLYDALPEAMRGGWRETSEMLAPVVVEAMREGDVVIVKGSNGSRMSRVAAALKEAARGADEGRTA